jgi:hypothetical protein
MPSLRKRTMVLRRRPMTGTGRYKRTSRRTVPYKRYTALSRVPIKKRSPLMQRSRPYRTPRIPFYRK